jgi:hypothetical protein
MLEVNELVAAVGNLLYGCGVVPPTARPTPTVTQTRTTTATATATVIPTESNTPTQSPTAAYTGTPTRTGTRTVTPKRPTATVTPFPSDQCPFNFNSVNSGPTDPYCGYDGTVKSQVCGSYGAAAVWCSDGTTVTAIIDDGAFPIAVFGTRMNATTATIFAQTDNAGNVIPFGTGTLRLPSRQHVAVSDFQGLYLCSPFDYGSNFDRVLVESAGH